MVHFLEKLYNHYVWPRRHSSFTVLIWQKLYHVVGLTSRGTCLENVGEAKARVRRKGSASLGLAACGVDRACSAQSHPRARPSTPFSQLHRARFCEQHSTPPLSCTKSSPATYIQMSRNDRDTSSDSVQKVCIKPSSSTDDGLGQRLFGCTFGWTLAMVKTI